MSIPYPPEFDHDYHAEWHEERRRRAPKALEPGDVIATVEATLAGEPDPQQHPLLGARVAGRGLGAAHS